MYSLTGVRGERAASSQLGPDLPFMSPQPFMSPRYAGGPRPPIRMGNQVLHSRAPYRRVSWGWLLFGEGGKDHMSCRCSLDLDGRHRLPWASSVFLVLEHQLSHNHFILIFFLRFRHIQGVNGGGACAAFYLWCSQHGHAVPQACCPGGFSLQSQKIKVMEIILLLG